MKFSLYTLLFGVVFITITACGPSEKEKQSKEKAVSDSLQAIEQSKIEEMAAAPKIPSDSLKTPVKTEQKKSTDLFSEDGFYVVQLGAWRSQEKAQFYINEWKDRDYPHAYVKEYGDAETGDLWYRVRIGFFDSVENAQNFGEKLAGEYNTGYWVSKIYSK